MEVKEARGHYFIVFMYEFWATAQLIFTLNIGAGSPLLPFCAVCCIFTLVIFLAPITGGHFNPAITAGVFFQQPNKRGNLLMFIVMNVAQFAGGLLGAAIAWVAMGLYNDPNQET